jgi:hypothetical protein
MGNQNKKVLIREPLGIRSRSDISPLPHGHGEIEVFVRVGIFSDSIATSVNVKSMYYISQIVYNW